MKYCILPGILNIMPSCFCIFNHSVKNIYIYIYMTAETTLTVKYHDSIVILK